MCSTYSRWIPSKISPPRAGNQPSPAAQSVHEVMEMVSKVKMDTVIMVMGTVMDMEDTVMVTDTVMEVMDMVMVTEMEEVTDMVTDTDMEMGNMAMEIMVMEITDMVTEGMDIMMAPMEKDTKIRDDYGAGRIPRVPTASFTRECTDSSRRREFSGHCPHSLRHVLLLLQEIGSCSYRGRAKHWRIGKR